MKVGIAAAALLLALGTVTTTTAAANEFGVHQPGSHVYDRANVLGTGDVSDLEAGAADVERAGAPTVVFIRLKATDDPTTRQDARALMDAWDVETSRGAHDGFVLLVNLRPADPRHGSAALVAGQRHADDGRLGDARLQDIYSLMRYRLEHGDLAGALRVALSAAASDLVRPAPPTPSSPASPIAALVGVIVFAPLALVLTLHLTGMRRPGVRKATAAYLVADRVRDGYSAGWTSGSEGGASHDGGSSWGGGDGGASSGSSSGGGSF